MKLVREEERVLRPNLIAPVPRSRSHRGIRVGQPDADCHPRELDQPRGIQSSDEPKQCLEGWIQCCQE